MKKQVFFTLIFILLTNGLSAQTNRKYVGVNSQYSLRDTTRTFVLYNMDLDTARQKLIEYWGTPIYNKTGNIGWNNIDIPGIGNELTIALSDLFCTKRENGDYYTQAFIDENDKSEKLQDIKSNQCRSLEIIITNRDKRNFITTKRRVKIITNLLEKILTP